MRVKELFRFIQERHYIYLRRAAEEPKPWTRDFVLQRYRFTNVYRENDTVTQWIATNWRTPHAKDPHLWFAMAVARHVNNPTTLAALGYPVPWCSEHFVKTLTAMQGNGQRVFNAAYMINAQGCPKGGSKAQYLAVNVIAPLWEAHRRVAGVLNAQGATLARVSEELQQHRGIRGFMAGQIIADLKYVAPLRHAPDWWTWAVSGPGSRRGLNWVYNRDITTRWKEPEWYAALTKLKARIDPLIAEVGMPPLHAQDLQNCLCEMSKYVRGYSRRKYPGLAEN
jgi:5-hmdU DNA kinase, helical domain